MMKKYFMALLALATALAITPAALADTFDFTVSGSGLTGGGSLIGSSIGGGNYAITGGTITLDGLSAIIVPDSTPGANVMYPGGWNYQGSGPSYSFMYDNILPVDSVGGILFQLSNGELLEIWEINGIDYYNGVVNGSWIFSDYDDADLGYGEPITMDVTATPEPSSLLLLGTGLLGLAFVAFRKVKSSGLVLHT
jgi:PEP-CTERM motif